MARTGGSGAELACDGEHRWSGLEREANLSSSVVPHLPPSPPSTSPSRLAVWRGKAIITRTIFQEEDDHILNYLIDDGDKVEPEWYTPVLPTVLINGAEGIGTGWSTYIPSHNPKELAECFKRRLRGE